MLCSAASPVSAVGGSACSPCGGRPRGPGRGQRGDPLGGTLKADQTGGKTPARGSPGVLSSRWLRAISQPSVAEPGPPGRCSLVKFIGQLLASQALAPWDRCTKARANNDYSSGLQPLRYIFEELGVTDSCLLRLKCNRIFRFFPIFIYKDPSNKLYI